MREAGEQAESLNQRIEAAWVDICSWHPSTKRTLYLTRRGVIVGFKASQGIPSGAIEIGTFTRSEDLDHFRRECFFAWNQHQEIGSRGSR